jgi:hypothetical protein
VLGDLGLVRWPKPRELRKLRKEETKRSNTELNEIRKTWREQQHLEADAAHPHTDEPAIRNHGLFSKAERVLQIAGWSERARNDIEIFRLVDTEGLTPLLLVLNEARMPRGTEQAAQPAAEPASS